MRDCYHLLLTKAVRLMAFPVVALALVVAGCDSQLETEPYSQITPDQFYQNEAEFVAAVTGVSSQLRTFEFDILNMQEHSSDEMMVPTRGPDWGDGGIWRAMTQHTWDATHPFPNNGWNALQVGVSRANGVLTTLQASEALPEAQTAQFAAETRFLRTYFYYLLMDLFGNVPIVVEEGADSEFTTQDEVTPANPPPQNTRAEVFSFVLSELTGCSADNFDSCFDGTSITPQAGSVLADLPSKNDVPYGRATVGAGYALLARVLLNAEIYTGTVSTDNVEPGTAMYDEASAAADQLLNSPDYMLADDYFANFASDNYSSPEIIFAAAHKADSDAGFQIHNAVLHYNQPLPATPWNGFTTIAEFYRSFDIESGADGTLGTRDDVYNDERGKQFMVGAQYEEPSSGCAGAECYSNPASGIVRTRGEEAPQLSFTVEVPDITLEGSSAELEAPGARPLKWELDPNASGSNMGNDFPIFRLGEMYLIKAEAENEVNGPAAAAPYVNALRDRAGGDNVAPPPATRSEMRALILQERGHEMHNEGVRRQDLIRYEFAHGESEFEDPYAPTYTGPWLFKQESEPYRALFPIPQGQISVNPNLEQNPGY